MVNWNTVISNLRYQTHWLLQSPVEMLTNINNNIQESSLRHHNLKFYSLKKCCSTVHHLWIHTVDYELIMQSAALKATTVECCHCSGMLSSNALWAVMMILRPNDGFSSIYTCTVNTEVNCAEHHTMVREGLYMHHYSCAAFISITALDYTCSSRGIRVLFCLSEWTEYVSTVWEVAFFTMHTWTNKGCP